MSDKVKVEVYVRTNKVGSRNETVIEFDREDWEEMLDGDKDEACLEVMFDLIEWGYEVIE